MIRRFVNWMLPFGLLAYAGYRMWRIEAPATEAEGHPVYTYEDALARLESLRDQDDPRVNPACRMRLLTHGYRTNHAVAIFHGLSNCPQQFVQFADTLHAAGYNVLLPRIPYHGLDRLTEDLAELTTEELVRTASQTADILHGLGEHVTVMGLSAGGALAAWCGQNRSDVDRIVAIAPALGLVVSPTWADRILANALGLLPNKFVWWDSELKEDAPGPPHAYPRLPTRAIGALIGFGKRVQIQSRADRPAASKALIILNPNDDVVRNDTARKVVAQWRHHGMDVEIFEFPAAWNLPHDLIDPGQADQQIDIVYPVVTALVLKSGEA